MRPNKVGWVLAFGFLAGGIAFWITIPEIFIGQIWVGVAVLLMVLYTFMTRRADRVARLRATGIPGTAQILELTQTGTYVNNQPMVKLRLRVEAPGVATFEDERREIVPLVSLGMLSSGGTLPVYIEPADHSRYVIDWGAGLGGAGAGTPPATISVAGGPPIDIGRNPAAAQAVLQLLREHGMGTEGSVDLRDNPQVRERVLEALREHGIDAEPTATDAPSRLDESAPAEDRLRELQELKDDGLITDDEFQRQRRRILDEI